MNITTKILCIALCSLVCLPDAGAQTDGIPGAAVDNLTVLRDQNRLFVSMEIDLSGVKMGSDQELLLTPWIGGKHDSLALPSVLVAGRNRYYHHLRNDFLPEGVTLYRYGKTGKVTYRQVISYERWMDGAELKFDEQTCGCFSKVLSDKAALLAELRLEPKVFLPQFVYLRPQGVTQKISVAEGTAYIDFPVNRTELYEDYRRNPSELGKIRATIDTIRNDADTRILSVSIRGYASPEGTYSNNERLAKGRAETLRRYVRNLYAFPDTLLTANYEPEDWAGLERYVQDSGLEHREAILAIILSDMDPDAKDRKIRSSYPSDYAFLLKEVYPSLRHSDYAVTYQVRAYFDAEEIRRVMKIAPQKLSLQELYLVAQNTPVGSEDYNEAFGIAVRMFPDDAVANLNAANIAMSQGDLKAAGRYLAKAGDAPETVYAKGICAALSGDYDTAETLLGEAGRQGVAEAEEALRRMVECRDWQRQN